MEIVQSRNISVACAAAEQFKGAVMTVCLYNDNTVFLGIFGFAHLTYLGFL